MQLLFVTGGAPLEGTVPIHGAKNSVLPILAASLLCGAPCTLQNCPDISDVRAAAEILRTLGCGVSRAGSALTIDAGNASGPEISERLAGKMRSSILFLGAFLARFGNARLHFPGGCPLGSRPIDLHLSALRQMGAEFAVEGGEIRCRAERLRGAHIRLPYPSVGATENVLLAAVGCEGTVILENAAREPEIGDLAGFLVRAGAEIRARGPGCWEIKGGAPLHGAVYAVLPDRIETATYLSAAAACGGDVTLEHARPDDLLPVLDALTRAGCRITRAPGRVRLVSDGRLRSPGFLRTGPYPGFPTDAQAPLMAALLRAEGETVFDETVFEDRFRHALQLQKLGASIRLDGTRAAVRGVPALFGARLQAEDLRGGAALVLGALQAEGSSVIAGVGHIRRGYDHLEENLQKIGARIKCVEFS
jgi:UDP-N-acetylglucosamine 1-carboxyvinyltransferase